ncbi:peroxiredoxin [Tichowtungia aerotolerans]|uniref:Alkyl hydroperoxide reductase C n=1 Tax=Tichowtungia aerotolerans TaxID=2697043 RepID=A0A6P1M3N8_9BACT|nr:redoxin domain-containing protein [Tichowtungia aerotolerans]QHI68441.1 redoxin domain-containing protein [Tichowtungia aerotolerans]
MLQIGQEVPDFEIEVFHNEEIKKVKLSDYKGKWVVFLFYPADFTFVCPTELKEAAQLYDQFQAADAEIISVSTDTAFVHKAWHDNSDAIKQVKYPMGSDPSGKICRQFGTYLEDDGVALRGTFIIDPDSILKTVEMHDLGIGRSAAEALRKLEAAKFVREYGDQVCPAGWKPGDDTITPGLDLVGKI